MPSFINQTRRNNRRKKRTLKSRGSGNTQQFRTEILRNTGNFEKYWEQYSSSINEKDEKEFRALNHPPTYGYLTVQGFHKLLEEYHKKSQHQNPKIFYDLGSGLAMPNVMAATFIDGLQQSIGIEFSESRHQSALEIVQNIGSKYSDVAKRITLLNGDILSDTHNYSNADMIWISSLCFGESLAHNLTAKLNAELKKGTQVFTSKELVGLNYSYHNRFHAGMSWESQSSVNHYVI